MRLNINFDTVIFFVKLILKFISYFVYTFLLIIPLLILRFKGYKFAKIKSDRVGHLVSETFSIRNDESLSHLNIIFLLKKNNISNTAYIEMFKKQ